MFPLAALVVSLAASAPAATEVVLAAGGTAPLGAWNRHPLAGGVLRAGTVLFGPGGALGVGAGRDFGAVATGIFADWHDLGDGGFVSPGELEHTSFFTLDVGLGAAVHGARARAWALVDGCFVLPEAGETVGGRTVDYTFLQPSVGIALRAGASLPLSERVDAGLAAFFLAAAPGSSPLSGPGGAFYLAGLRAELRLRVGGST